MLRVSNQNIDVPGSTQITDEYPHGDVFPNSHNASDYYEWCHKECERMGTQYFVYNDFITEIQEDGEKINIPVCHIRRHDRV